jgi:integrase-like protein
LPILWDHTTRYHPGRAGLIFPNQVGMPLRRTLFRARVWRPTLVRAGLLGIITEINSTTGGRNCYRATWTTDTGDPVSETFGTYPQAIKHVARHAGEALRFHDLRHSYATWLVDDEVPPNMVQRVMGHEHVSTTLQLYVRRTEHHERIRKALGGIIPPVDDPDDDDGTAGPLVPIG